MAAKVDISSLFSMKPALLSADVVLISFKIENVKY